MGDEVEEEKEGEEDEVEEEEEAEVEEVEQRSNKEEDEVEDEKEEENESSDEELDLDFDGSSKGTDSSDFLGGATKETLRDYLQNRIRSKDPLLVERSEKMYTAPYSRTCPTVGKRQPVVLTDEEKEFIDSHHPGSYGKALTYNTKDNQQLHYICPRYWCVDENISLNANEVNIDGDKITSEYCKDST